MEGTRSDPFTTVERARCRCDKSGICRGIAKSAGGVRMDARARWFPPVSGDAQSSRCRCGAVYRRLERLSWLRANLPRGGAK